MIRDILEDGGLRSRQTVKCAPAPLSRSQVHWLLSDDFYIGVVTWDGAKNPNGRHAPLIDRETFEKVQEVMRSAMLTGNRTRKHKHYLRGSLFCGNCGRLWSSHEYAAKPAGPTSTSAASAIKVGQLDPVAPATSSSARSNGRSSGSTPTSASPRASSKKFARPCAHIPRSRRAPPSASVSGTRDGCESSSTSNRSLLHLFYKEEVDEDMLAAEQKRIAAERTEAKRWAAAATQDAAEIKEALNEALKLLKDPHIRYREAELDVRRLFNQALFEKLFIHDEDVTEAKPSPWVTEIHRVAGTSRACLQPAGTCQEGRRNGHGPLSGAVGLNKTQMVRLVGQLSNPSSRLKAILGLSGRRVKRGRLD
jgi:site-specific DNA recombinase